MVVKRSVITLFVGIVIGLILGFGLAAVLREEKSSITANDLLRRASPTVDSPSARKPTSPETSILLGNITTVPFQELYGLLSNRSRDEITKLAEQLKNLPEGRDKNAKLAVFFVAWAHLDAKSALSSAASLGSAEARSAAIGGVVEGIDPSALGSIVKSLEDLSPGDLPPARKGNLLRRALAKWSQVEPAEAAQFLEGSQLDGRDLVATRRTVAEHWAASDPQAALAWAQRQGGPQDTRFVISGVLAGWLDKDPRGAEDYVASHLDTLGPEASATLAVRLFKHDQQQAKDWVNQLPSVEARRTADSLIAMEAASVDPKGASEWAAALPDNVRDKAIGGAITAWATKDPEGAGQWMSTLSGTVRDEAILAYSAGVSGNDPSAGLNWAASISDPIIRESTLQRIVGGFVRRSPNYAPTWIQNSKLSDTEKARLLSLVQR